MGLISHKGIPVPSCIIRAATEDAESVPPFPSDVDLQIVWLAFYRGGNCVLGGEDGGKS